MFMLSLGEKIGMHSHPASTLHYLTDGKLKITYPDGRIEERTVKAGSAVWSEAVTHAVENIGTNDYHGDYRFSRNTHRTQSDNQLRRTHLC